MKMQRAKGAHSVLRRLGRPFLAREDVNDKIQSLNAAEVVLQLVEAGLAALEVSQMILRKLDVSRHRPLEIASRKSPATATHSAHIGVTILSMSAFFMRSDLTLATFRAVTMASKFGLV